MTMPSALQPLPSRFWADLSTREFSAGVGPHTVAVLPVAAVEQHGPHLPCSVDLALVDGVIRHALPHLGPADQVLFLPTQAVGKSNEHVRFAGTLTLSAQTLIALWTEIGESVARAGVKKLVLFNSHGGQVQVMDVVARDLRARLDMLVWSVNWFGLPMPEANALFDAHEHRYGIHAGDMETSMMLALNAPGVNMAHAQNFASTSAERSQAFPILGNGQSAKLAWQTQDLNPFGAAGNAQAATAEKGQAVLDAAGRKLAELLGEVQRVPLGTLKPKTAYD
jgi:creatinine amidohydrolase